MTRTPIGTADWGDDLNADLDQIEAKAISGIAGRKNVMEYGAVGDGIVDDTVAVQAALTAASASHASVFVPADKVFKLSNTLNLTGDRVRVYGGGELRWTSGITNKDALYVTGDSVTVENIKVVNYNSLGTNTGVQNVGIRVDGNNFRAVGNHVENWQYGIAVWHDGEWADATIHNNRVIVLGAGSGPSSGDDKGEDRGDGITVWGCQASIVGNVVSAKTGTDARIGIHTEGLPGTLNAPVQPPHPNMVVTISNNVVYGKFRRGIVDEDVSNVAITGNTVADATWWGIAVASAQPVATAVCRNVTVSGNTVKWTRLSTDNQGSAYSPVRAPIALWGSVIGASITGNTIEVQSTGVARAFIGCVGPSNLIHPEHCVIADNVGRIESGGVVEIGVFFDNYSVGMKVANNILRGFNAWGVYGWSAFRCSILGNTLTGTGSGTIKGVDLQNDGGTQPCIINDNHISGCPTTGIQRYSAQYTLANSNIIEGATTGFDWYGATNGKAVGNLIIGATTAHASRDASILITD